MDQAQAKKTLQELLKNPDLKNKTCADCGGMNPQWASLSFASFICLTCAGVHRGFGVHISFVRSISMDTWQPEQIKRMQLGGNGPLKDFLTSYGPEGGYTESASLHDKYHSWAAAQYREKLDSDLAEKPWSKSSPPADFNAPASAANSAGGSRPSSAQGLRKSRASTRQATGSSLRSESGSPSIVSNSSTPGTPLGNDQKSANENYFAKLGQANASRPENLPPSQGGRYTGFGSTPAPDPAQSNPLSSVNAPTLTELQNDPGAALSKGWSLFSAAVAGASRTINQSIIQPTIEKASDPNLHASVMGYVKEGQTRAYAAGQSANEWSKHQFGVDVAESVGGVVDTVRGGGPSNSNRGYGALAQDHDEEHSSLYNDPDDFFNEHGGGEEEKPKPSTTYGSTTTRAVHTKKKSDDWDEWKDF